MNAPEWLEIRKLNNSQVLVFLAGVLLTKDMMKSGQIVQRGEYGATEEDFPHEISNAFARLRGVELESRYMKYDSDWLLCLSNTDVLYWSYLPNDPEFSLITRADVEASIPVCEEQWREGFITSWGTEHPSGYWLRIDGHQICVHPAATRSCPGHDSSEKCGFSLLTEESEREIDKAIAKTEDVVLKHKMLFQLPVVILP